MVSQPSATPLYGEVENYQYHHASACSPLTLVVNINQKNNLLLSHITELRVEYALIVPDYLLSHDTACMFLSLEFHRLNPGYLKHRAEALEKGRYRAQFLLCLVDLADFENALQSVTITAFNMRLTLLLAWCYKDVATHIQSLKQLIDKPIDSIEKSSGETTMDRLFSVLTSIPTITKIDAASLLHHFGTLNNILCASQDELALCPGIGKKRLQHLWKVLHEPITYNVKPLQ